MSRWPRDAARGQKNRDEGSAGVCSANPSAPGEAVSLLERGLGGEHVFVAGAKHNLALALRQTGELREAETMAREALESRRRRLREEHVETRESQALLGELASP